MEKINTTNLVAPLDESQGPKVPEGLSARAFGVYVWAVGHGPFTIALLRQVFAEGHDALRSAVSELVDGKLARQVAYSGEGGLRRTAFVLDAHDEGLAMIADLGAVLQRLSEDVAAGVACAGCGQTPHEGACP